MLSLVADTNQFLSGFIYHGMSKVVFDLVFDKKINLYISTVLKDEVLRKLQEFGVSKNMQNEVMTFIETKGILVEPTTRITECRDPEDNFLLELAETSRADFLITRDRDLLDLPNHKWKTTKIIKPETFLPLLRDKKFID